MKRPSLSRSIIAQYQNSVHAFTSTPPNTGRHPGKSKTDRAAAGMEARATTANRTMPSGQAVEASNGPSRDLHLTGGTDPCLGRGCVASTLGWTGCQSRKSDSLELIRGRKSSTDRGALEPSPTSERPAQELGPGRAFDLPVHPRSGQSEHSSGEKWAEHLAEVSGWSLRNRRSFSRMVSGVSPSSVISTCYGMSAAKMRAKVAGSSSRTFSSASRPWQPPVSFGSLKASLSPSRNAVEILSRAAFCPPRLPLACQAKPRCKVKIGIRHASGRLPRFRVLAR